MMAGNAPGGFTRGNRFLADSQAISGAADDVMTIASVLTNPELAFVVHMLQQKGNADLLSSPKVTTRSGSEATIKVVTEYIYPTSYEIRTGNDANQQGGDNVAQVNIPIAEPQDFETREVGVVLSVLPEVSSEGRMINLTMTPEVVSEPEWRDYGYDIPIAGQVYHIPLEQPFFHTRTVSTSISIYNGATVVMGGMISEVRVEVDDKVPFFGDIPLVGRLFQSRYEKSEKRNLLIFVTARLVDPSGQPLKGEEDRNADNADIFSKSGVENP